MKRIAIIAGEASGDLLAARLILALRKLHPDAVFEGIAGPEMQAAGCVSFYPLEKLSVMGLTEVLKHLPELLRIRRELFKYWQNNPPELFIGVDAPDFNLPLAAKLHTVGIATVHYVSPSVWAWRQGRVKKLQGKLNLMLCLFPFEVSFYTQHGVPAALVGHPLADEIAFNASQYVACQALALPLDKPIIGLLPGSRRGEIKRLAADFFQAARLLKQKHPEWCFVVPAINANMRALITQIHQDSAADLPIIILDGQSRLVMQAADYILLASGTAVLEGMLAGRLMVAAYKLAPITIWILRTFKLLKVRFVTLPNNLANEALVPELLQEQVTPDKLAEAMEQLFNLTPERRDYIVQRFQQLHAQLRQNASQTAATTISERFLKL